MKRYQISIVISLIFVLTIVMLNSCKTETDSSKRIEKIIGKMTFQEKVEFIGGYQSFNIRSFEKHGIPEIRTADGPAGIRNYGTSTAYPASINLAASWDKDMARRIGQSIAMEARSKNVHFMLGPAMNICRAPYCGRNFEYLGEDPYLAGEIASSYVIGMQSEGVVATAKHYAANNQEFDRNNVSSDMDERTLREIYLPAFEACVKKGKVGAVMTSYNLINGIHASQNNHLNNEILKGEWGFDGIIMSDWESTYDGVACALGGLDLEMPSGKYMNTDTLISAINSGKIKEEIIDEKVRRILKLYERFGYLDNPDISKNFQLNKQIVRDNAIDAARGGITLLKNDNQILPIDTKKSLKIAVVGINADPAITGGGGSSLVNPEESVSLLKAIEKLSGKNIEVTYAKGLYTDRLPKDYFKSQQFYTFKDGEKVKGISATFYKGQRLEGTPIMEKVYERLDFSFGDSTITNISKLPSNNFSARFSCFLKVSKSGNYSFALAGDDGYRMFIDGKVVLEHWVDQAETVRSFKKVLDRNKEYKIVVEYYQAGGSASIRLGYDETTNANYYAKVMLNKALNIAKSSDIIVISAGFNNELESEGIDRTFEMPYNQDDFIHKIAEVNKNCIVVLNAGGNVKMEWLPEVAGLIHAWYPGQQGNLAVAEIIFGITNPSGKLPVSFEKRWIDNATYKSYFDEDKNKKVTYSEGVFLGYRHFDQSDIQPLFPFGYGLSYTKFEYSDLKLSLDKIKKGSPVRLTFKIKNIGNFDGAEIAQVYVHDQKSLLPRPVKELKGFDKIFLKQGEQKQMTINLDPEAFRYFNINKGGWIIEPGKFTIIVGSSSKDLRLEHELEIVE